MEETAPRPRPSIRIEVTGRSLLLFAALVAAAWLFWKLSFILIMILVALILAGTLTPLVARLESWRVPRGLALVLVFTALLGAVVVLGLVTVPALVGQLVDIVEKVPDGQKKLAAMLERYNLLHPLARSVRNAQPATYLASAGQQIVAYGSRIAFIVGEALTTLFLAFYIVAGREREQAALFAVVPRRYHLRLARIMLNLGTIVGGYVRGQILTSICMAVFVFLILTAFGAPNALAIAVFAGITDIIPFVGGLIATAPTVAAAYAAGGLPAALVVLVAMILYQELESRLLVPRIYGRVLRLSPVIVILALLVGGTLYGIVGALLALPVAAAIRMMIKELRVDMPGDDVDRSTMLARDEAAEQEFHEMAAGAAPGQAAEIATELAEKIRAEETEIGEVDPTATPLRARPDERDPREGPG